MLSNSPLKGFPSGDFNLITGAITIKVSCYLGFVANVFVSQLGNAKTIVGGYITGPCFVTQSLGSFASMSYTTRDKSRPCRKH